MGKMKKALSLLMIGVFLIMSLTGCSITTTNNLKKSPLEYNKDYIQDLLGTTDSTSQKIAEVLDDQGAKKLMTNSSLMKNGSGHYKVGDGKQKWIIVIEDSTITEIQTKDGETIYTFDWSEPSEPEKPDETTEVTGGSSLDDIFKEEPEEPVDQDTSGGGSLEDIFGNSDGQENDLQEALNEMNKIFKYVTVTDISSDLTVITGKPNGNLNSSTTCNNVAFGDLAKACKNVNSKFNEQLFYELFASSFVLENEFGSELDMDTLSTMSVIFALISDKFVGYRIDSCEFDLYGSSYNYHITDGTNSYELKLDVHKQQLLVDGADYTSKILVTSLGQDYLGELNKVIDEDYDSYGAYMPDNVDSDYLIDDYTFYGMKEGTLDDLVCLDNSQKQDLKKTVENFYNSKIDIVYYEDYEEFSEDYQSAKILMENKSYCSYSHTKYGDSVYDNKTYDTIWESWKK